MSDRFGFASDCGVGDVKLDAERPMTVIRAGAPSVGTLSVRAAADRTIVSDGAPTAAAAAVNALAVSAVGAMSVRLGLVSCLGIGDVRPDTVR